MGKMNLLQSKWDGKVGQLVGAKWKNKATVHAYTKPKDAKSESQLKQRNWFKPMQKACTAIAKLIRGLTNIKAYKITLANALMSANKGYDPNAYSKPLEGIKLIKPQKTIAIMANLDGRQGGAIMNFFTWSSSIPQDPNITYKKCIGVLYSPDNNFIDILVVNNPSPNQKYAKQVTFPNNDWQTIYYYAWAMFEENGITKYSQQINNYIYK